MVEGHEGEAEKVEDGSYVDAGAEGLKSLDEEQICRGVT